MKDKYCRNCGQEIGGDWKHCPNCGTPVSQFEQQITYRPAATAPTPPSDPPRVEDRSSSARVLSLKERITSGLGSAGVVVWYIISIFYSIAPLMILKFPLWVDLLLILAMTALPFIGETIRLALFIWAFVVAIHMSLSVLTVVFFVFAAIYVFTEAIPLIVSLTDLFER